MGKRIVNWGAFDHGSYVTLLYVNVFVHVHTLHCVCKFN